MLTFENVCQSTPALFAQLGYGFFVLITISSYTANLATILVAKSNKQGISSIQDAIDQGVTICVLQAVERQVSALFPKAKWHMVSSSSAQVQALNLGTCGAALIHEQRIKKAWSGDDVISDCKKMEKESLSTAEIPCERDEKGDPLLTRDCKFKMVRICMY